MGGQIVVNNSALPAERAVVRVATHLKSFWTPAMIEELAHYAVDHPEGIDATLLSALEVLAAEGP